MPVYNLWGADAEIEISKEIFPSEEWLKEKDELFDHPEHGWFESSFQKKKLHYRKNIPKDGNVKAILVWQHGICGQSGFGMKTGERFTDHALRTRTFNQHGIAVYAADALGHGYSEGTRFYIPQGKWEINRDDLVKFCQIAAKEYPDIPLIVSGDSYGGCLALHTAYYFQTHPDPDQTPNNFLGASLNCPSIEGDLPPKPVVWFLQYGLAPLWPKWTPFFMPHPITSERVWKEPEPRAYFSNKEEMHDLSRGGVSFCLGTAVGLLKSLQQAQIISYDFNVAFHISHGDQDYGIPLSGSQHLMEHCQTPAGDKCLNVIQGGYHGLFSQKDAEDIMNHELEWIQTMMQKKQQEN